MYGLSWLQESWKYIREDITQDYRWLMLTAPLGKTPMDRKGGQAMRSYAQKLDRTLEAMTPWTHESKFNALRRKYGKSMGDETQIVVTFDPQDDPGSSLFMGATTEHELQRKARDKRKAED